jgi:hypothetical protein
MSDVGQQMLLELRRIRELLEAGRPLGFGKKQEPVFVFIRHSPESLWYTRDKRIGENIAIPEPDLTGYLKNVWRYDRTDQGTGEVVAKLMLEISADRHYIIQSGFDTNFSKSFLAGLLELPPEALDEPLTLVVEDNTRGRGRPTVFARLEHAGVRVKPAFDRTVNPEALLEQVQVRFGFSSPFERQDEG